MIGIAVVLITCLYLQMVLNRDKARFKELQRINKNIERERKRRLKEEKLKNTRVKHPKICYLDDYRRTVPDTPKIS